jgi:hypothetical protein
VSNVVPISSARPGLRKEFRRQVQELIDLDYPELLDLDDGAFRSALKPLAKSLPSVPITTDVPPEDNVPFVLVVNGVPSAEAAARMTLKNCPARLMLNPDEIDTFRPIEGVDIPGGFAYLLTDIDTGTEFCNVRPADALPVVTGRGRSALTIDEGIALVTQRPDMLRRNKCFSLLASRCGDKRVPAIWISAGAPKLGWCWDGNPHTWLGSASVGARIAI